MVIVILDYSRPDDKKSRGSGRRILRLSIFPLGTGEMTVQYGYAVLTERDS
jgi:hypothetical protein